jgi:hypothetical protein
MTITVRKLKDTRYILNDICVHHKYQHRNCVTNYGFIFETTNKEIEFVVFWVVGSCSGVIRYQRLGRPCCLHLEGEVNGTE